MAMFNYIFTAHAQKRYLGASGKNPDISVRFLYHDFLTSSKISAIWGRFRFIFSSEKPNIRHISTSVLFDLL